MCHPGYGVYTIYALTLSLISLTLKLSKATSRV